MIITPQQYFRILTFYNFAYLFADISMKVDDMCVHSFNNYRLARFSWAHHLYIWWDVFKKVSVLILNGVIKLC